MRSPSLRRSVVLAALACVACNWPPSSSSGSGSGNGTGTTPQGDAPVIDALNMSPSASSNGSDWVVSGSITFHCDDDVVQTIQVVVPTIAKTINVDANGEASAIGQSFYFQLPTTEPLAGATTYTVSLITKGGVQSQPIDESVVLQ